MCAPIYRMNSKIIFFHVTLANFCDWNCMSEMYSYRFSKIEDFFLLLQKSVHNVKFSEFHIKQPQMHRSFKKNFVHCTEFMGRWRKCIFWPAHVCKVYIWLFSLAYSVRLLAAKEIWTIPHCVSFTFNTDNH